MARTCRRRTFAQVRAEQDRAIAKWIGHHAEKLAASGQREAATAIRALAGMVAAGFVETSDRKRPTTAHVEPVKDEDIPY